MKIFATTLLLLLLIALSPGADAHARLPDGGILAASVSPVVEEKKSFNFLTKTRSLIARPQNESGVSALDLSLFGIISLGVLGLFWIRRHTSEL